MKNLGKAAGIGALTGAALTADAGNPLINAAGGAVVGAVAGAVSHFKGRRANMVESAQSHGQSAENFGTQANWSNRMGEK